MSVQLNEGKTEIKLTKDLFKNNLTNVILELDHSNVKLQGVITDFWKPKHYFIEKIPDEFSIILQSRNDITEIIYYCGGKNHTIKL